MLPDLHETIVALSSTPGAGARAIIRLSGNASLRAVRHVFQPSSAILPTFMPSRRQVLAGGIRLPGVTSLLPADLYLLPAPQTYTGQHMAELHTLSCPPLVDLLIAELLQAGARAAQPGEFTLRAFLAGKLDLPRAEAVLGIIEAADRSELQQALTQLAGGVTQPLQGLREDLLNLLADVEAGLDFTDEDIQFVGQEELLNRLAKGLAQVTLLKKQLDRRTLTQRRVRVVLTGRPNAGKSSLFNALTGGPAALVSPQPGTTRDYLVHSLDLDGVRVDLVDTAGTQPAVDGIEQQAQALGRGQAERAHILLLCVEPGLPPNEEERRLLAQRGLPIVLAVATKCDRCEPSPGWLATSAVTGQGLGELRRRLGESAKALAQPALAPSLSRCRHHVEACLEHLRRAHGTVLFEEPAELLALELRSALDHLGEMVGAVYSDDLLDRIFSRFCIGK